MTRGKTKRTYAPAFKERVVARVQRGRVTAKRGRPKALAPRLVGPMRPLVAGGDYDPAFHSFEVLSVAGLGASYDDPRRVVLVPMVYDRAQKKGRR